jgi:general secretion pathway protein J
MKARGFTLVEMLVTLALVALVGGLLWQALATVARLETQLARTRSLSNDDLLRRAWVEQALAGVMTGPQGDPFRFDGRAGSLSAYTTMPPRPGSLGPERLTLELQKSPGGWQLLARLPGTETPLELWRWAGDEARFEYLDGRGRWHDAWPPMAGEPAPGRTAAPAAPPPLPAAIRLVGPPAAPVLVAVAAGQSPMLRQQDLLPDDAPRPR